MAASPMPRLTPEEYLAIERAAEFKSEYYDGQMFAMAGGTLPHSILPMRLAAALINGLGSRGCEVAGSDLKIRVSPKGPFVYPDLTVYCGEPQLADDYRDVLLNPRAVFEDRGLKFEFYRGIESLQEYVIVSQSKPLIEVYLRQPDSKWLLSSYSGMDAVCPLASIDCSIRLVDVYQRVKLGD
jgi:Uma2 family endonuclease